MSHLIWFALILVVLSGGCIVFCLIRTQVMQGDMWRSKGEEREKMLQTVLAHRGNIVSSDGMVMATTIPVCDLYLDLGWAPRLNARKQEMTDKKGNVIVDTVIRDRYYKKHLTAVCRILHKADPSRSTTQYRNLIESERRKKSRCVPIIKGMPYSYWKEICAIEGWGRGVVTNVFDANGKTGVIKYQRAHTFGNLAENCLGFYSGVTDSYTGLDGNYDSILRGHDGLYLCRRLTRGVWIPMDWNGISNREIKDLETGDSSNITMRQAVVDGTDIMTTLDTRYQDVAENSLRRYMRHYCGSDPTSSGAVVLMEVATGKVLACVSLRWDSLARDYRERRDANVACNYLYQPGSVFKTVAYTTMFDDLGAKIDTGTVVPTGMKSFSAASGTISDGEGGENVSTITAFGRSSNVGVCQAAWDNYGDKRSYYREQLVKRFPLDALDIDLKTPRVKGRMVELRYDRDFLNVNYGYGVNCTPLQIATFYAALGNKGRMMKPQFCYNGKDRRGKPLYTPVVLRDSICSPATARTMLTMLTHVVEHGTGDNIKGTAYGIAGKTGTAYRGTSTTRYFDATFAGLFPTSQPRYVCVVVVMGVYGMHGRQFAPVLKEVADCVVATHKELWQEFPKEMKNEK